jgi:hypothetical protein
MLTITALNAWLIWDGLFSAMEGFRPEIQNHVFKTLKSRENHYKGQHH